MDLLTKFEKSGEFEVFYLFLKHLDYLDAIQDGYDNNHLISIPLKRRDFNKTFRSIKELTVKINDNERKYGIRPANRLISYNYMRSTLPSFDERELYETILFEQETMTSLIEEIKPDAMLGELSRSYYIITYDLCRYYGINYFNPLEIRASYYGEPLYALFDDLGDKTLYQEYLNAYIKEEKSPTPNAVSFANDFEARVFNTAKFGSKKLRNFESDGKVFVKKIKKRIKTLKSFFDAYNIDRKYFAEKLTFKNQVYSVYKRFIVDVIRTPIIHFIKSFYYTSELDLSKIDYVYFPLHFYPELVSSVWGNQFIHYHDQELHLIQSVSKNLPTGYKLLVKEHMPMVNNRKISFYKKINSFYNAKLIAPSFNSFDLTQNSKCVITISSTTGFEAFLKDKPVLTFMGAFYKHIPTIKVIDQNLDIHDQIINAIETFETNHSIKINALCAFYDSSCTFKLGENSVSEFDISYDESSIKKIAEYLKSFISDKQSIQEQ